MAILSLYLGILGLFYAYITSKVIKSRIKNQISVGDGNNTQMMNIANAHNNFNNYVPICLIILFVLESIGKVGSGILHLYGISLVLGRVLHFYGMTGEKMNFKLRRIGMTLTLSPLVVGSIICLLMGLQGMKN